jgi:integrase/recombinase XerD
MTTDVERAVQDYLSHLSVERGLADNTLHSYRRDLRRYLEFLLGRDLAEPHAITENDIAAFLGSLSTGSEARSAGESWSSSAARSAAAPARIASTSWRCVMPSTVRRRSR